MGNCFPINKIIRSKCGNSLQKIPTSSSDYKHKFGYYNGRMLQSSRIYTIPEEY